MHDLQAKLHFLQQRASYGNAGAEVECIETHMSWVFRVGAQVFKLKKPVRFAYLDFSSLALRELYCREEVRLNARLAPGVYLGVVALQWRDGAFALVPPEQHPAPAPPWTGWCTCAVCPTTECCPTCSRRANLIRRI